MTKALLIKKENAKLVDLGTKFIQKYTSSDRQLEINHMTIKGRHPDNENHYVYETEVHFMMYVLKGSAKVQCDNEIFDLEIGDVIDVPPKVKFAVTGDCEYLVAQSPAWYPEQAFISNINGKIIESTEK